MPMKRPCAVCGLTFQPTQYHAKVCCATCRQRLHRGGRLFYVEELPQVQQQARRALHQAIEDTIAIEKVVRAARRERRKIGRRMVRSLAPLTRGSSRGGGFMD
jgi:hypothetical protein